MTHKMEAEELLSKNITAFDCQQRFVDELKKMGIVSEKHNMILEELTKEVEVVEPKIIMAI